MGFHNRLYVCPLRPSFPWAVWNNLEARTHMRGFRQTSGRLGEPSLPAEAMVGIYEMSSTYSTAFNASGAHSLRCLQAKVQCLHFVKNSLERRYYEPNLISRKI